jgi:DNA excision repair protein ERCC-2
MVLADRRFLKKRSQLPKWINQAILESEVNLSTDMAVGSAKKFLRSMAQPFKPKDQEGISTWSLRDLEKFKEKQEEESIRQLREGMADTVVADQRVARNGYQSLGKDEHEFDDDELEASMMELNEG